MPTSNQTEPKSKKIKALILSGLIFPGTGQLVQGKKLLGVLIIGASFLLLALVFKQLSQELIDTSHAMAQSGNTSIADAFDASNKMVTNLQNSSFFYLFYGFVAVWGFSILEVFREPASKTP